MKCYANHNSNTTYTFKAPTPQHIQYYGERKADISQQQQLKKFSL